MNEGKRGGEGGRRGSKTDGEAWRGKEELRDGELFFFFLGGGGLETNKKREEVARAEKGAKEGRAGGAS